MKDSPQTGTGDLLISVQAIEPLKIPMPDLETEKLIENIIDIILSNIKKGIGYSELENKIDQIIYSLYNLSKDEIEFVESQ